MGVQRRAQDLAARGDGLAREETAAASRVGPKLEMLRHPIHRERRVSRGIAERAEVNKCESGLTTT